MWLASACSEFKHCTGFDILLQHVAVGAIHDAAERFNPPRCHPGTRVAAQNKIKSWVEAPVREYPILWLNGLMGAGKSAIAQMIAEYFNDKSRRYLLATFIFSRGAGDRNNERFFVATIAYQLALSLPQLRPLIERAVEDDPLLFSKSLRTQLSTLIIDPLQSVSGSMGVEQQKVMPRLILIDGLDECQGSKVQESILMLLVTLAQQQPIPLAIFIASRPEPTIRETFDIGILNQLSTRITLDTSYKPDEDIQKFLIEEFARVRERHESVAKLQFPLVWPTTNVINTLLVKSSGQFIYPSVVVKFVGSIHYNPISRLDIICGLASGYEFENPYAELDVLFLHILSCVKQHHLRSALRMIGFKLAALAVRPVTYPQFKVDRMETLLETVGMMEVLMSLKAGDSSYILADLSSLISIDDSGVLNLMHASLGEFLVDRSRSGDYHIDLASAHADILCCFIKYVELLEGRLDVKKIFIV